MGKLRHYKKSQVGFRQQPKGIRVTNQSEVKIFSTLGKASANWLLRPDRFSAIDSGD
jgi:hypothetical protein